MSLCVLKCYNCGIFSGSVSVQKVSVWEMRNEDARLHLRSVQVAQRSSSRQAGRQAGRQARSRYDKEWSCLSEWGSSFLCTRYQPSAAFTLSFLVFLWLFPCYIVLPKHRIFNIALDQIFLVILVIRGDQSSEGVSLVRGRTLPARSQHQSKLRQPWLQIAAHA